MGEKSTAKKNNKLQPRRGQWIQIAVEKKPKKSNPPAANFTCERQDTGNTISLTNANRQNFFSIKPMMVERCGRVKKSTTEVT
jgi:hypothetical protein